MNQSYDWWRVTFALIVILLGLRAPFLWAHTLGTAPQFNTAVQGQDRSAAGVRVLQLH